MANETEPWFEDDAPPPEEYRGGGGRNKQSAPPVAPESIDDVDDIEPIVHSEQVGQLAAALAAAQGEMTVAVKDRENTHLHSRYATLAAIAGACMPALSKNGIAVMTGPKFINGGMVVAMKLVHGGSGEFFQCTLAIRTNAAKGLNTVQILGSAITYLRRYLLTTMSGVAIAEGDDDDGEGVRGMEVTGGRSRGGGRDVVGGIVAAFEARFKVTLEERTPPGLLALYQRMVDGATTPEALKQIAGAVSMFEAGARQDVRCEQIAKDLRAIVEAANAKRAPAQRGGVAGRVAAQAPNGGAKPATPPLVPGVGRDKDGNRVCEYNVRGSRCGAPIADDRPVDLCDKHVDADMAGGS